MIILKIKDFTMENKINEYLEKNKCPYCGYELYNHSKEIYDEKIEDVKKAKSKLISVQLMIAIAALIVVAIAGVFVAYKTVYRHTDKYITDEARKHLQGKSGAIEDKVVFGWAVHFYDENADVQEVEDTFKGKTVKLKADGGYEEVKPVEKPKKAKKVKEPEYEEISLF